MTYLYRRLLKTTNQLSNPAFKHYLNKLYRVNAPTWQVNTQYIIAWLTVITYISSQLTHAKHNNNIHLPKNYMQYSLISLQGVYIDCHFINAAQHYQKYIMEEALGIYFRAQFYFLLSSKNLSLKSPYFDYKNTIYEQYQTDKTYRLKLSGQPLQFILNRPETTLNQPRRKTRGQSKNIGIDAQNTS